MGQLPSPFDMTVGEFFVSLCWWVITLTMVYTIAFLIGRGLADGKASSRSDGEGEDAA